MSCSRAVASARPSTSRWDYVDLTTKDYDGRLQGEINLPATIIKTRMARTIFLHVCPMHRQLLAALKLQAADEPYVFGGYAPLSRNAVAAAHRRLVHTYGAPDFSWQELRRTTGTYLTNAPGIFGGASVYRSAAQLGHDVAVAEKHYLGATGDIARKARTLEAVMQIEDLMVQVIERVSRSPARRPAAAV